MMIQGQRLCIVDTVQGIAKVVLYLYDNVELVRLFCVILAAYPLEFATKMSNVRLPFVSL